MYYLCVYYYTNTLNRLYMLKIENLNFRYSRKGKPTISNFNLELREGGIYGLLGENGAGKSTLLQLIMGLLTPESGKVLFDSINTRKRLPSILADMYIVPEENDFPPIHLDTFTQRYGALYPKFSLEDMNRHLSTFGITGNPRLDRLSMGQKKKIALSFAMACNTTILLMDEPTNGLDIPAKSAFRKYIVESMDDKRIFLISTHQVRDVSNILDHIIIMDSSKVLLNQSVAEIQSTMKFTNTSNQREIENALFAIPSLGGATVILQNLDNVDTEINLETLFSFAIQDPEKLNSLF